MHAPAEPPVPQLSFRDLDGFATGLAMVGKDGRVLACNAAFRGLTGDDAAVTHWALRYVAAVEGEDGKMPARRLHGSDGRALIAQRLPLGPDAPAGQWLLAIRASDGIASTTERLAELFGLAPREAQIAGLLLEGHDVKSVARRLDIAVSTARVHLRNIFRKTQTSRQPALLIALVNAAAI